MVERGYSEAQRGEARRGEAQCGAARRLCTMPLRMNENNMDELRQQIVDIPSRLAKGRVVNSMTGVAHDVCT